MGMAQIGILVLTLLSLALSGYAIRRDEPLNWRFAAPGPATNDAAARFVQVFDYTAPAGQAHSPAILAGDDGFSLVWFEGSQEAQADVDIHAVHLTRDGTGWQAIDPAPYVTRNDLGHAFGPRQLVVTLGNTIQNEAADNALYVTAVSVGGWAMASVADVRMGAAGPARARKLNLSPFLNRSFLVKSPMVAYADGSHALPAYFEMGATYGALVRLDGTGRVRDMRRITGPGKPIQPMIVPLSETRAVAFLRDFDPSGRLMISRTADGGQVWSVAEYSEIANPSAPVAALALPDGRILMAMNDDPRSADRLQLAISGDEGGTWRVIHTLEDDGGNARYPMLRRLAGGRHCADLFARHQTRHPRVRVQRCLGGRAMTELLTTLSLATLLAWLAFAGLSLVAGATVAVPAGALIGLACALALRGTVGIAGAVALLAPFGVMLPALAARQMAMRLGVEFPAFTTTELSVFLAVYLYFLASAFGVVPGDLYRLGYAPVPVAAMVLALCAYGAWSGNWFIPLVAVAGQLGWVMHWTSSNWFDTITHVLLVPMVVIVLILRVLM